MSFRMARIFLTPGISKDQRSRSNPENLKLNISKTVRDREKVSIEVR